MREGDWVYSRSRCIQKLDWDGACRLGKRDNSKHNHKDLRKAGDTRMELTAAFVKHLMGKDTRQGWH